MAACDAAANGGLRVHRNRVKKQPLHYVAQAQIGEIQCHDTNRVSEAEPLLRRALEIDEKSYGPDHPKVALALNNLAQQLIALDRFADAVAFSRSALAIEEKSYGPDHPNVGRDLNNLADLLQKTNRLDEAEPLLRRALDIY